MKWKSKKHKTLVWSLLEYGRTLLSSSAGVDPGKGWKLFQRKRTKTLRFPHKPEIGEEKSRFGVSPVLLLCLSSSELLLFIILALEHTNFIFFYNLIPSSPNSLGDFFSISLIVECWRCFCICPMGIKYSYPSLEGWSEVEIRGCQSVGPNLSNMSTSRSKGFSSLGHPFIS